MFYNEKWLFIGIFIIAIYVASLYFAYSKGYQKHVIEVERESAQIIIDSRNDVVHAIEEAKNVEKDFNKTDECSSVLNFNLRANCLQK